MLGLVHIFLYDPDKMLKAARAGEGGGFVGYVISYLLTNLTGKAGATVVIVAIFLIGFIIAFNFSLVSLVEKFIRKEIKELVTLQLFISLLFTIGLFYFIGQMAKKEIKKAMTVQKVSVLDLDQSPLSKSLLDNLRLMNFQVEFSKTAGQEEAIQSAKDSDANLLLVIPGGFGESVSKFEMQPIETYTFLRSFSISGTKNSAILGAVVSCNEQSNYRSAYHYYGTTQHPALK